MEAKPQLVTFCLRYNMDWNAPWHARRQLNTADTAYSASEIELLALV